MKLCIHHRPNSVKPSDKLSDKLRDENGRVTSQNRRIAVERRQTDAGEFCRRSAAIESHGLVFPRLAPWATFSPLRGLEKRAPIIVAVSVLHCFRPRPLQGQEPALAACGGELLVEGFLILLVAAFHHDRPLVVDRLARGVGQVVRRRRAAVGGKLPDGPTIAPICQSSATAGSSAWNSVRAFCSSLKSTMPAICSRGTSCGRGTRA